MNLTKLQLNDINLYLETKGGEVFFGNCVAVEISSGEMFHGGPNRWTMELAGIGELAFAKSQNLVQGIVSRIRPPEWECQFCGRANYLEQQQCQSCGWYRGVVVDVVQEMGVWRPRY